MKRTLLAVGVAVLISMMLVPHGDLIGEHFLTSFDAHEPNRSNVSIMRAA
jgi:hypothetical protein